jgi:hypothetical protein
MIALSTTVVYAANLGYACLEQRPTRILQPPRSPKSLSGGGESGKSLQAPT